MTAEVGSSLRSSGSCSHVVQAAGALWAPLDAIYVFLRDTASKMGQVGPDAPRTYARCLCVYAPVCVCVCMHLVLGARCTAAPTSLIVCTGSTSIEALVDSSRVWCMGVCLAAPAQGVWVWWLVRVGNTQSHTYQAHAQLYAHT